MKCGCCFSLDETSLRGVDGGWVDASLIRKEESPVGDVEINEVDDIKITIRRFLDLCG